MGKDMGTVEEQRIRTIEALDLMRYFEEFQKMVKADLQKSGEDRAAEPDAPDAPMSPLSAGRKRARLSSQLKVST